MALRAQWWLVAFCAAVTLLTASGRIVYPDGEIVFETTEALATRGAWSVDGMPFRTGEPRHRPDGSFGVDGAAPDGRRYGFFGHALSVAALPLYGLSRLVPTPIEPNGTADLWRRAPRRDVFTFHLPDPTGDWHRMITTLTNVWISALVAWATARWAQAVGFSWRAAILGGLLTVLGTYLWCYGSTFMSEPLSAAMLIGSAASIARWRNGEGSIHAAVAGSLAGMSVHAHLLNVLALPCLLGYAVLPERSRWREDRRWRNDVLTAGGCAAAGLFLLALSQWIRFGSPLETGRFGHYGHLVAPWEGLAAMMVGPGRSLWLFAPAITLGLFGIGVVRRRAPPEFWLVVAMLTLRLVFVATRSDWYGGWTIGPRYLAPLVPFLVLPLVAWLDEDGDRPHWARVTLGIALTLACLLCGWLAVHDNAEFMWRSMQEHGVPEFYRRSHWVWRDSPFAGYARLDAPALRSALSDGPVAALAFNKFDVLWIGAYRLRLAGHPGLWRIGVGVAALACVAGWRLFTLLRQLRLDPTRGRQ